MQPHLVVLDIDGTLLHTGVPLAEETIAGVAALHTAGHQICIASARPEASVEVLRERLDVPAEIIAYNGAVVRRAGGGLVSEITFTISPHLATELASFVARGQTAIEIYLADGRWWGFGDADLVAAEEEATWIRTDATAVSVTPAELEGLRVHKFLCDGEDLEQVYAAVSEIWGLHITQSGTHLHDIWHEDAGKGNALRSLVAEVGIEMERVISVGDSDTDVPMLMVAGAGIAVEPCSQRAREVADVTAQGAGSAALFEAIGGVIDRHG